MTPNTQSVCELCKAGIALNGKAHFRDGEFIGWCKRLCEPVAEAASTGVPPKVEEITRKIMDEVRRRADNELDNMGAAEYEAILCPYFPPSPAHFSDCDYDCSCGWKKDPDSHLGAVRG